MLPMFAGRDEHGKSAQSKALLIGSLCLLVCCTLVFFPHRGVEGSSSKGVRTRAVPASAQVRRSVTVADAVRMTRLADPLYEAGLSSKGMVGKFSPDGTQFVVVLRKGNLEKNANDYSILLFRAAEAFQSPEPRVVVSLTSSSNRPAIKNVTWLDDNDTILFLGEHPGERTELWSFKCSSGVLRKLTNHPTNLTSFATTAKGNRIVYASESQVSNVLTTQALRNGIHVSHEALWDLIRERFGGGEYDGHELFVREPVTKRDIHIQINGRINFPEVAIWLSPDGKYFIVQTEAKEIREEWSAYEEKFLQVLVGRKHSGGPTRILQYELVDIQTGTSQVLLDAPIGLNLGGSEVAWSPDSQSVVVSHVYLPLNSDDHTEQAARRSNTFLVEVKIPSREFVKISSKDLRLLEWDRKTNTIVCEFGRIASLIGKPTPTMYFRKTIDKWSEIAAPEDTNAKQPVIVLEENLNTPPRIVAVDPTSGGKSLLMDLNPQFSDLSFGKVDEVEWKDTLGNEVKGGLYWPAGYTPGNKYPLVIQTHGWNSGKFWIDGPFTTAFAAQPLASKGFFVLQDTSPEGRFWDSPEEAPRAMAAYQGAIDYLDRRGLIDRDHTGLIGFSRTCFHVTYTLTHSNYPFSAAAITDGIDGGYFQYMAFSNSIPPMANEFDLLNGAPPFGEGLSLWTLRSPGFLMDKVQTPLRIHAIGPTSLLAEWEWFSGLSRLGKPVDMVYTPEGTHILEKPWDRITSQQGNVDWFCFWLKGEEDPNPAKAEQYARWRKLREIRNKTTPRTPTQ